METLSSRLPASLVLIFETTHCIYTCLCFLTILFPNWLEINIYLQKHHEWRGLRCTHNAFHSGMSRCIVWKPGGRMVNKMLSFQSNKRGSRKRTRRVSSPLISHLAQAPSSKRPKMLTYTPGRAVWGYSILWVLGNWSVVPLEKTADFIGSANRTFVCHVSLFQGARGARHREFWVYSGNRLSHTWVQPAPAVMNLFTWPFTQKKERWIKKGEEGGAA